MSNYNKVMTGLSNYIDREILTKINGVNKWLAGAAISIALKKSDNVFSKLKSNTIIQTLGIIDENDDIDVSLLYTELKKQAKSPASIDIPMIGKITLRETDIDMIYEEIMREE